MLHMQDPTRSDAIVARRIPPVRGPHTFPRILSSATSFPGQEILGITADLLMGMWMPHTTLLHCRWDIARSSPDVFFFVCCSQGVDMTSSYVSIFAAAGLDAMVFFP